MTHPKSPKIRGILFLLIAVVMCAVASREFLSAHKDEPLFPSASLKTTKMLSDYFAGIRNTRADTPVYVFEGREPGGTTLIIGGTHPNEVAGFLAAYLLVENASVSRGRLIVIPRANHSAFTTTEPGEAQPAQFEIKTAGGARAFRCGGRFTNPLDQWPDPEVYLHFPSGQQLSGAETRNMNRAYPGRASGDFTERAANAITALVRIEKVNLVIDLHESSPEYPVINAIVAHERAMDMAALANLSLQGEGLNFALEPSPQNFHGLTHRELGDTTTAQVVLLESANIMQGRLRGKSDSEKVLNGKDEWYLKAAQANLLRVPYDSSGIPVEVRVGRHLSAIRTLMEAMSMLDPNHAMTIDSIPDYAELQRRGIGAFLSRTKTSK